MAFRRRFDLESCLDGERITVVSDEAYVLDGMYKPPIATGIIVHPQGLIRAQFEILELSTFFSCTVQDAQEGGFRGLAWDKSKLITKDEYPTMREAGRQLLALLALNPVFTDRFADRENHA